MPTVSKPRAPRTSAKVGNDSPIGSKRPATASPGQRPVRRLACEGSVQGAVARAPVKVSPPLANRARLGAVAESGSVRSMWSALTVSSTISRTFGDPLGGVPAADGPPVSTLHQAARATIPSAIGGPLQRATRRTSRARRRAIGRATAAEPTDSNSKAASWSPDLAASSAGIGARVARVAVPSRQPGRRCQRTKAASGTATATIRQVSTSGIIQG